LTQRAHEELSNSVTTNYTYDTLNRLTDVIETHGTTVLLNQHFVLNDDGTRASLHQERLQSDNTTIVTTDSTWTYDDDGRLTGEAVTSSNSNESYSNTFGYDLAGNRLTLTHTGPGGGADATTNYTYDARNEMITQNGATVSYDNNGSETTGPDGKIKGVGSL
jgi:YD repeat-containing protein